MYVWQSGDCEFESLNLFSNVPLIEVVRTLTVCSVWPQVAQLQRECIQKRRERERLATQLREQVRENPTMNVMQS